LQRRKSTRAFLLSRGAYLCASFYPKDVNFLSAELISKSYNDKWLFRDISIGISQGENFALVGNNGTGKSTLLRILTGEVNSYRVKVVLYH